LIKHYAHLVVRQSKNCLGQKLSKADIFK